MRLYALCDQDMLEKFKISLEDYIKIAKENDAEIIQYRAKNRDLAFIKSQLIKIRKLYDGFLVVNDAYELIEFCDGVHVGQEDLRKIDIDVKKAVAVLRSVIKKDKILGVSTHNEKEILELNDCDLNYIGLGAYRSTSTKTDITSVLGDKVDELALKSKHYVAVIGGVRKTDKFKNVTYNVMGSGLLV